MPDAAGAHHLHCRAHEGHLQKNRKRALRVKWGNARRDSAEQGADDERLADERASAIHLW
jgi:hypothetical protein